VNFNVICGSTGRQRSVSLGIFTVAAFVIKKTNCENASPIGYIVSKWVDQLIRLLVGDGQHSPLKKLVILCR
jgi:hypothetical protein